MHLQECLRLRNPEAESQMGVCEKLFLDALAYVQLDEPGTMSSLVDSRAALAISSMSRPSGLAWSRRQITR